MSDILSQRTIKNTRKVHSCDLCGRRIERGSPAISRTFADGGQAATFYMHLECSAYADATFSNEDWEWHSPGDIKRDEAIAWLEDRNAKAEARHA